MVTITDTTFGLSQGDLIVAKVSAYNAKGMGPYSNVNTAGAKAQVVPHSPDSAPYYGPQTSDQALEVRWPFITDLYKAGGSSITSYELMIDDGSGFREVVGFTAPNTPYTLNQVLISSSVQSGLSYQVKYRAQNIYGWGDYSPIG